MMSSSYMNPLARIAHDYHGQLDYVVLGHNLGEHILRPYPRPWP